MYNSVFLSRKSPIIFPSFKNPFKTAASMIVKMIYWNKWTKPMRETSHEEL